MIQAIPVKYLLDCLSEYSLGHHKTLDYLIGLQKTCILQNSFYRNVFLIFTIRFVWQCHCKSSLINQRSYMSTNRFLFFQSPKNGDSNIFLGNTQNSRICSGDFLFLFGVIAFRLFSILSKGSSLLSGVILNLSGVISFFSTLVNGMETTIEKSRQVLPNIILLTE